MQVESTIIKLTNLSEYEINAPLKKALEGLEWRLQANQFLELFAQVEGKTIIGIGMSWLNAFHPHAKYIRIASTNGFHLLLAKLLHTISPQEHLIYSCWSNDTTTLQHLQNLNFHLFRQTYMETYFVNELLTKMTALPSFDTLLSLEEVLQLPKLEESLFQLVKHNYESTHLHNPVNELSWQMWKEVLLEDAPDLQLSYIALAKSEVVAYVFLHPSSATVYDVGWVGTRVDFDLHSILKAQLHKLKEKGILEVAFEVDTTDFHAWEFATLLELKEKTSWNSYHYKPNLK